MEQELFIRYFAGTSSPEEEVMLLNWIETSEENRKEYLEQRRIWDTCLFYSESEDPSISFSQLLIKHNNQLKANHKNRKRIPEWIKYAAILIIAITAGHFIYNDPEPGIRYNTIEVPSGQRVKLTLPDGSLVWLNAQTKFVYPAVFDDNERKVILDGEGLFEIKHSQKHPFYVQTPEHQIKVSGTTFNVYAYSNSTSFETVLIDGCVMVDDKENQYLLQPGDMIFYDASLQKMVIQQVNPKDYTSWKDGIYYFNDITFLEMIKRLSHYYNTRFIINDSSILNIRCTGKFRQRESINEIMDVVKSDIPFGYKYDNDNNEIVIEKKK